MGDETTPATPVPGAPGGPVPGQSDPATPPATPAAPVPGSPPEVANPTAQRYAQEAAEARTRAAAAEAELAKLKQQAADAKLTDQQRLEKRAADAEAALTLATARVRDSETRSAIGLAAIEAGITPRLATRLVDLAAVQYDAAGAPTNIDALLKALADQYPELVKAAPAAPAAPGAPRVPPVNPGKSAGQPGTLTKELIAAMKPDEYTRRRAEIHEWLAKQTS